MKRKRIPEMESTHIKVLCCAGVYKPYKELSEKQKSGRTYSIILCQF